MAKKEKFAGLRERFFQALQTLAKQYNDNDAFSGNQILADLEIKLSETTIQKPELEFIKARQSNFFNAAKEIGLLRSFGKGAGYQILKTFSGEEDDDPEDTATPGEIQPVEQTEKRKLYSYWEGFSHIPVTLVFSEMFKDKALIESLPASAGPKSQWNNPDMIMVRDRYYQLYFPEKNMEFDPTTFSAASSLTLIESPDNGTA